MPAEQLIEPKPRRRTATKAFIAALLFLIILVLLALFFIPVYISSPSGQKTILAKINTAANGRADFADLTMSWRKGLLITDFTFTDSSSAVAITAKKISALPHYTSILTGGLSFGQTIIDQPRVVINLKNKIAKKTRTAPQKTTLLKTTATITLPIKKIDLVVNDGRLKVTDRQTHTAELSKINASLNLRPPGQQTNFKLNTVVAANNRGSQLRAEGRIKPKRKLGWNLAGTTGDLTIEVDDLDLASLGPILVLAGIDIEAKGKLSADIKSEIIDGRLKKLVADVKGSNLEITTNALKGDTLKTSRLKIDAKMAAEKRLISINTLKIQTDWFTADATGEVPTTFDSLAKFINTESKRSLKANLDCDLVALARQIPHTLALKEGTKITSGRLTGSIEKLANKKQGQIIANAQLTGLAGLVDGKAVTLSRPVNLQGQITSDASVINFKKLDISTSFGNASLTGTTKLLHVTAAADMAKFQTELGQFFDTGQSRLAGQIKASANLTMTSDKISVAGTSDVKNLRITSPGKQPFFQNQAHIVFDADYRPNQKNWAVRKLILTSPDIKIKGNFQKQIKDDQTKLKGQADLEYDWSGMTAIASPFLPPGLKLAGKRNDSIKFDTQYPAGKTDKLLANLNTKGNFGFDRASYMGLNFGKTDIDIQVQQGLMKISPFTTTVNNGQLSFAGDADFKQTPALLKTPRPMQIVKDIQITPETTEKLLKFVNPLFADATDASGVASLYCQRLAIPLDEGYENDIEVLGTISAKFRLQGSNLLAQILSVAGASTRGRDITIHPTDFVLRNGFLSYEDMRMDVGEYPLNFKGTIGLNKSLNMTITLPYTISGRTVKTGRPSSEQRLSLALTGTTDRPELDMGKLLEDQLKKELERQLQKGLEQLFK